MNGRTGLAAVTTALAIGVILSGHSLLADLPLWATAIVLLLLAAGFGQLARALLDQTGRGLERRMAVWGFACVAGAVGFTQLIPLDAVQSISEVEKC